MTLRILRPFLLLVAIAAAMLWLLGGRTHTWTTQLGTEASPDRIFRELTDPDLIITWKDKVIEIEPLNELPPGVGARARIVTEDQGRRHVTKSEVVEFELNRLLKVRLEASKFDATSTYIIERRGGLYQVQQRLQSRHKGLFRLVAPFIGGEVQEQLDADFRSLKKLLDEPDAPVLKLR